MEIAQLQKSHIKNALELIWSVFQEFEAPDYSEQGVNTFKDFIRYEQITQKFDNGQMMLWGCFISDDLKGVIAIRDNNHISMLFVKEEYQSKGIAKKLFQTLIEYCKANESIKSITVNSSPYAVEIYHHLGFKDINTEQTVDGIRFTSMEYIIE
ncbi:GCN5-related N-acetyltransferase [Clostridium sp. DL-VIII]|uniref:GNAT family N-acetyltransferase n=1 Tax=Clostridium sp. DL-VIII TaxID=641107 RepID=UPI00023AFB42|nr:GNAT family N-acetyltransferase [Clostridium sp. DL-VIII]EHJ00103.1 GCN5-related N-acetyltransferase [Clostridium sp. DL-VIII]